MLPLLASVAAKKSNFPSYLQVKASILPWICSILRFTVIEGAFSRIRCGLLSLFLLRFGTQYKLPNWPPEHCFISTLPAVLPMEKTQNLLLWFSGSKEQNQNGVIFFSPSIELDQRTHTDILMRGSFLWGYFSDLGLSSLPPEQVLLPSGSVCMGLPSCFSVHFLQGLCSPSKLLTQDFPLGIPVSESNHFKGLSCSASHFYHRLWHGGSGSLVPLLLTGKSPLWSTSLV